MFRTLIIIFSFFNLNNNLLDSSIIGKWKVIDFNIRPNSSSSSSSAMAVLFGTENFPAKFIFGDKLVRIENKKGMQLDESNYKIEGKHLIIQSGSSKVAYLMSFKSKSDTVTFSYNDFTYTLKKEN